MVYGITFLLRVTLGSYIYGMRYSPLRSFIREMFSSPAAFFLGSDSDSKIRQRIKSKGFIVVEGRYDVLVYHPAHWQAVPNKKAMAMLEGFSNLPPHGAFDAGADHPYSHVLLPTSQEAVDLTRRLFGLTEGSTFKDIIIEAMSRRDFLKKAAMTAAAGAAAGPAAAAKSIGGAVGAVGSGAIKTAGGAALGDFLSREIWYAVTKEALHKAWEGAKRKAKELDPSLKRSEIKMLDNHLKQAIEQGGLDSMGEEEVLDKIAGSIDKLLGNAKPAGKKFVDEISAEAFKNVHGYDPRNPTWINKETGEKIHAKEKPEGEDWISHKAHRQAEYEKRIYGQDPQPWEEFEGFDDIPYVDDEDDEDRPWLGEFRAPAPSLRHLMKAWPGGRDSWLREIDIILS